MEGSVLGFEKCFLGRWDCGVGGTGVGGCRRDVCLGTKLHALVLTSFFIRVFWKVMDAVQGVYYSTPLCCSSLYLGEFGLCTSGTLRMNVLDTKLLFWIGSINARVGSTLHGL